MRFKRITLIIPDHLEVETGENLTLNKPGSWLADGQVLCYGDAYNGCHACARNLDDQVTLQDLQEGRLNLCLNCDSPYSDDLLQLYCRVCRPDFWYQKQVRFTGVRCQDCHIPLIKKASLMWRMCLQCRRRAGYAV